MGSNLDKRPELNLYDLSLGAAATPPLTLIFNNIKSSNTMINKLKKHLSLIVVIMIAVVIALVNIDFGTHYSGWDNILAEFNLTRYARQVFFGSWLEHQSMGAPAAQGHLSEIPRLPILLILKTLLPDNLVRYAYIFGLYLIGGIGTYFYLLKYWLNKAKKPLTKWLASLGALFYLLHILTLQQFYISFEMFMAQFAFLPFLLMIIHRLSHKLSYKNLLRFLLIQFLIAPSGHTSTVFYLGTLFSLIYAFFLKLDLVNKIWPALKFSFIIGLFTLLSNFYWIGPNIYYGLHHAEYVQQSHDNQLFGPESVWSIREAGTISNFLKGTHYLFTWKDYSFADQGFDFIFNEWQPHLDQPAVNIILHSFGILTLAGLVITALVRQKNKDKDLKRWAVILFYIFSAALVWINLLPTEKAVMKLFQSQAFLETFRNPFTKLSILYSFVSILLIMRFIEFVLQLLKSKQSKILLLTILNAALIYSAWPSFQGHFISEKLKVKYPPQYERLFTYMEGESKNKRVLILPQMSHAGWTYHDWQFIEEGNGYQGMGFMPFGLPQPVINRDSDRWIDTSNFFYHELKYALDKADAKQLAEILEKYQVDFIIIDETKIEPKQKHDYQKDHQLTQEAGLNELWQEDFLTIYERPRENLHSQLLVPDQLQLVSADQDRIKLDQAFALNGHYLLVNEEKAHQLYPFSKLLTREVGEIALGENQAQVSASVPKQDYRLVMPALAADDYYTPAEVKFDGQTIEVTFPQYTLKLGENSIDLPKLNDFTLQLPNEEEKIALFFNQVGLIIQSGNTAYPVLNFKTNEDISVSYNSNPVEINLTAQGEVVDEFVQAETLITLNPDWQRFANSYEYFLTQEEHLVFTSDFATTEVDLAQLRAHNCSSPKRGEINTEEDDGVLTYYADDYAVNCSGYQFPYMSPAYSYLVNFTGSGLQGRGLKLFINYTQPGAIFDDFLLPETEYDFKFFIPRNSIDPKSKYILNWETRSFGRESVNQLESIKVTPFPVPYVAQLRLEKEDTQPLKNQSLEIKSHFYLLDSIHLVSANCQTESCYLGLDQSYDDLWLAFVWDDFKLLPHYRLNNWANVWKLPHTNQESQLVIFYLPELVSLSSLALILIATGWLVKKSISAEN